MVGIKVNGNHPRGVRRKVIDHIAAARRDGDDAAVVVDTERRHVDVRVFPNLVIDKPLKHHCKQTFHDAPLGRQTVIDRGFLQKFVGHEIKLESDLGQNERNPKKSASFRETCI